MDLFAALHGRRSHSVLTEPAPSAAHLDAMIAAAAAAPDHGRREPWRFSVLAGEGKTAFADVLEKALRAREAADRCDEARVNRERGRLDRAPMVIVTSCLAGGADDPITPRERYAATCAATQNLLLAATALGYGTIWRTGLLATDPIVREALGLGDDDEIVGFVYVGTVPATRTPAPRPPVGRICGVWPHDRARDASPSCRSPW